MIATPFLGLGTNLGDRFKNLTTAVARLVDYGQIILKGSSIYLSNPYGLQAQPSFYNTVIQIQTHLTPFQLLRLCKNIEREMGRTPGLRWGPRTIDIDILLWDRLVLHHSDLTIPHPGLTRRRFVLEPLLEMEPDMIDPVSLIPLQCFIPTLEDENQRLKQIMDASWLDTVTPRATKTNQVFLKSASAVPA